jgi:hypothetical protein
MKAKLNTKNERRDFRLLYYIADRLVASRLPEATIHQDREKAQALTRRRTLDYLEEGGQTADLLMAAEEVADQVDADLAAIEGRIAFMVGVCLVLVVALSALMGWNLLRGVLP